MANRYNDIFTYLKWRGDLSFEQDKFNEVDGFIFSQLTFLDLSHILREKMLLKDLIKLYFEKHKKEAVKLGLIIPDKIVDLIYNLPKYKRFANVEIVKYQERFDKVRKEQFAAVSFLVNNELIVAYKGTDDTLIGWEEDFNMIVSFPIAAQTSALNYLNEVSTMFSERMIRIVGHSKGGNLAMYACIYADDRLQARIKKTYNYDGPGFELNHLNLEQYEKVKNKIKTIIPEHSVIGMIFNQLGKVKVVKSKARGLYQHDGLTWWIEGYQFIKTSQRKESINFAKALNELIALLSEEERTSFCKSLENYIEKSGARTLLDLNNSKKQGIAAAKVFTKQDRAIFMKLIKIAIKNKIY